MSMTEQDKHKYLVDLSLKLNGINNQALQNLVRELVFDNTDDRIISAMEKHMPETKLLRKS